MSKPNSFSVIFLFTMLFIVPASAQEDEDNSIGKNNELVNVVQKNEFENLISTEKIVYQLRKNYGIKGSVILTKALWQILTSYSNQQQAQNIWQSAVNLVNDTDQSQLESQIDLEYSTAQILSKYSNGMDLQKWHKNRTQSTLIKPHINNFLELNDDLNIYLKLHVVWEIMLLDIIKQENIMWTEVFANSIDLFALDKLKVTEANDNKEEVSFLIQIIEWGQNEDFKIGLAELVQKADKTDEFKHPIYQSLLRHYLNKSQNNYLATALNWFELVYHFAVIKDSLSETQRTIVSDFIEMTDTWFLSQEASLITVNVKFPDLIESSIHNLKSYYRETEGNMGFIEKLPNVYQIIEPRFNNYMATPFRVEIQTNFEVCLNISEETLPLPQQITLNQFLGCMNDFQKAAVIEAKTRELSGALSKIETTQAFDRRLKLPAWQNINILYANEATGECIDKNNRLVSPFEWIMAAESLLWFKDRWPGYMASQADISKINNIILEGERLIQGFDCVELSPDVMLKKQFSQIDLSWQKVKTHIKIVANEFNQSNLSLGSDIDLLSNSEKPSNYRVEDAIITACDAQKSCGVHVDLESSRALFGLFPNHLLMADQLQLGKLKLCYDNVGWENRRTASTHLDNDSVANYFGNFSFSIKGLYDEELIFERKLIAKSEQKYLFAENNEDVLATYCPLAMVGSKISTNLKRGTYGLVPNRLTFLTASRANESKILTNNWLSGEEWRDQISNPETTVVSENSHMELVGLTQQSYQEKANELQTLIYKTMLNHLTEPTKEQILLTESFKSMIRMTRLFAQLLFITHPNDLLSNDQLHGLLYGVDKIPDILDMNEFYQNQLNINLLIDSIDENMKNNQIKWNKFDSYWSHAYLKNILFRLKTVQ